MALDQAAELPTRAALGLPASIIGSSSSIDLFYVVFATLVKKLDCIRQLAKNLF